MTRTFTTDELIRLRDDYPPPWMAAGLAPDLAAFALTLIAERDEARAQLARVRPVIEALADGCDAVMPTAEREDVPGRHYVRALLALSRRLAAGLGLDEQQTWADAASALRALIADVPEVKALDVVAEQRFAYRPVQPTDDPIDRTRFHVDVAAAQLRLAESIAAPHLSPEAARQIAEAAEAADAVSALACMQGEDVETTREDCDG